jgi:hypothetical protein
MRPIVAAWMFLQVALSISKRWISTSRKITWLMMYVGVHHRAGTLKSHWAGGNSTRNLNGGASMDGKCISLCVATMSVRRQLISASSLIKVASALGVCVIPGDWRQTPLWYKLRYAHVRRHNGDVWSALSIYVSVRTTSHPAKSDVLNGSNLSNINVCGERAPNRSVPIIAIFVLSWHWHEKTRQIAPL